MERKESPRSLSQSQRIPKQPCLMCGYYKDQLSSVEKTLSAIPFPENDNTLTPLEYQNAQNEIIAYLKAKNETLERNYRQMEVSSVAQEAQL